uniref:uncharacterized protein LOC120331567 n=1 Tax=Styela clava TaxID=7725 RepID=UPI00193ABF9F|nr:uncharacterized protein LOC120331567 [Styela clava]
MELDDSDAESPDQPSTSHDREDPTTSQNTSQALSLPGTSQALDQNLARGLDLLMKEPKKHVTVIAAKTVTFTQKQGDTIKAGNYFSKCSDISFEQLITTENLKSLHPGKVLLLQIQNELTQSQVQSLWAIHFTCFMVNLFPNMEMFIKE